jgi:hypothetical protein
LRHELAELLDTGPNEKFGSGFRAHMRMHVAADRVIAQAEFPRDTQQ